MVDKKTVKDHVDPPKTADEIRAMLGQLGINEADVAAAVDWARKPENIRSLGD